MLRFCIILCLLVTFTQQSSGQKSSKGCGDPGVPKHGYRVGDHFGFLSSVEYFCNRGFKLVQGSSLRECQENGKWSGYVPKCTDVDECVKYDMLADELNDVQHRNPGHLCHEKATCVNTVGSFKCECNLGYHGNGKICIPTNFKEQELLMKSKRRTRLHACGTITSNNTARNRRIVGGRKAGHGAWPWQAAILYKNYGRRFLFNGAFIKPRWVLTVASALKRSGILVKPQKLQVTLGEHNRERLDGTERYVRVKRMVIHPKYNRHTLSNNIALLELAKPVKPSSHIRTVCLPRKKRDARLEQPPFSGYVAGWGSRKKLRLGESTGPLSPTLQQVEAPLVANKVCKRSSIYTYDKSNYFCAGYRKKAKAPCFSDVGSPMVVQSPRTGRWVVLGLFGWSEGCGQPNKYAYYTRVTKYRRWILSVLHRVH